MATVTNAVMPRIDFTCLHTVKSQQPTHISCSAFLTHPPPPPSPSQLDIDMDDANNHDFIDSDTFGGGTSLVFPNSSGPATPVTSKCVRTASDDDHTHSEASSGTKCAKLDNVTSNSSDGSTTSPSHSKEKKVLQFAVGYVNSGKPKAADYEDVVQALLLRAMHDYKSCIVGVSPYPNSANQSKWAKICWKDACCVASDVRARLGLARPDNGLRKSKPEPQALKSLSWPKPWAQAAALHT